MIEEQTLYPEKISKVNKCLIAFSLVYIIFYLIFAVIKYCGYYFNDMTNLVSHFTLFMVYLINADVYAKHLYIFNMK